MNNLRYVERNLLCKYDLSEKFFDELGIQVEDVIPLRKIFVLTTDEGKKVLKITDSSKERLEFIDKSLAYISKSYQHVLSYYKNKKNEIYQLWGDKVYVLLDMVEGREVTFTNLIEIELCAKAIANMHKASKGIFDSIDRELIEKNRGAYLPQYFKESLDDLKLLKKHVSKFKYRNEFDNLFLQHVNHNIKYIEKAISLLALSNYNDILKDDDKTVLCHNDLAHHNFIVDGDVVKIIDFDYCNIDTRIMDIANYGEKVIKAFDYDLDKFEIILNKYNDIQEITKDEVKVLYCVLNFPKDFVNIVKGYYYKQKSWEEEVFLNRLKSKISNEENRKEFLNNFIDKFYKWFY